MAAAIPNEEVSNVGGAAVVDPDRLREDQLLSRLRAGEDSAFEELVRDVGGRLLSVARRMLPNDEDAQDAVQDAFVSAFKALPNFDGKSRLSTWLHRIVVNASLMKLRTKRRKPLRSIDDLMPRFFDDGHHVHPSLGVDMPVDKLVQQTEVQKAVREAIDELPEDYRTVLVLRDLQGLDTAEAAEVLDITPNAVKTRLHRARLALRELMRPRLVGLGENAAPTSASEAEGGAQ